MPAEYDLSLTSGTNLYVQSARWGGTDILGKGLNLVAGGAVPWLEIVAGAGNACISGKVVDENGEPQGNAFVVLRNASSGDAHSSAQSTFAKGDGRFEFQELAPGTYFAFAIEEEIEVWSDEGLYEELKESGMRVTVGPKECRTMELRLTKLQD
jgi:hypothetical protein